jgi:UPF0042 nucleotide-binding protein
MTRWSAGFLKRVVRTRFRRWPPTTQDRHALLEAIQLERELLSVLKEQALVIDTTLLKPARLLSQIKDMVGKTHQGLTLVFESFAFKRGIPMDARFCVRCPHAAQPPLRPGVASPDRA